jgi:hypothetical protein
MNVNFIRNLLVNNKNVLSRSTISFSSSQLKKPFDDPVSFVSSNKNLKFKDRLYVWGYAGTGALGKHFILKKK